EHTTKIQIFLSVLLADVDAMAAPVVFLAEGADELALRVEDDDRILGLVGRLGHLVAAAVLDIDQARLVDRHAVGLAPVAGGPHLSPVVVALVTVVAPADDLGTAARLVAGMHERWGTGPSGRRGRGQGGRAGLLQEVASEHGGVSLVGFRTPACAVGL